MKFGLFLLLCFVVLGALLGTLIARDPGYVLVAYDQYAWETSLWFWLLVLVLFYFVLRFVIWSVNRLAGGFSDVLYWNRSRRRRLAQKKTAHGLLLWAEGDWQQSRRLLVEGAKDSTAPLINYLHAARAANSLGDEAARDDLLQQAEASTPGSKFALGLVQTELQIERGQHEQALARLLQLRTQANDHPKVLGLMLKCYEALKDWPSMLQTLPAAEKARALPPEEFSRVAELAWRSHLANAADEQTWQALPKELKTHTEFMVAFVDALLAQEQAEAQDLAEQTLRQGLRQSWRPELVERYGAVASSDAQGQLKTAENWLRKHPSDAPLLLALGRLSMRTLEWSKAREYFEASLRLSKTPAVYGELGRLCVAMGDTARGSEYLLQAAGVELAKVPLPERPASDQKADADQRGA